MKEYSLVLAIYAVNNKHGCNDAAHPAAKPLHSLSAWQPANLSLLLYSLPPRPSRREEHHSEGERLKFSFEYSSRQMMIIVVTPQTSH
jgi:hypothetical protein